MNVEETSEKIKISLKQRCNLKAQSKSTWKNNLPFKISEHIDY